MAVPPASAAKVVTFGGFKRRATPFRMAGMALRDILSCFTTRHTSFCVTGALHLHRSQKMTCVFRGRRFWRHFAWQARHFRRVVACFANRIVRAASSVTTSKSRGMRCLLGHACDEN